MSVEKLTGRSRLRACITTDGGCILVLQVEVQTLTAPPMRRWRDAKIEDLSETDVIPALKVSP